MLRWWIPWLVLLVGCGGAKRVVRLDTGKAEPVVVTPSKGVDPVDLGHGEFRKAVAKLARDVRPSAQPLHEARQRFWATSERVLPGTGGSPVTAEPTQPALELTKAYGRWCERKSHPSDCLHLLEGSPTLDEDGKSALALSIALDSVWDETAEALVDMADPAAVRATLVSGMAMYLMLWVLPEPVSKGVAATMTACLMAYLGVDTVWHLIHGWVRLVEEVRRADTFDEVRGAGERYGAVLGHNTARILVMVATAVMGSSATGLAEKVPTLPGFARASRVAQGQAGLPLGAIAEVQSIALSAEGFTIALAPGAVAMAAQGSMGGGPGQTGFQAFKSFDSFKRTLGPAGANKQWHHLVEQTPGNVERFGPEALHNTENLVALESGVHTNVSRLYSSIRSDITGSGTLTVRKWLSTQSYEAQRQFGLRAIENVRKGIWP
jgi:hypothetical protein